MQDLPTEIWLHIISYCEPRDLWLGLRLVNRQLRECAEEYFECELLPNIALNLPVAVPTYDMRTQVRGKAIFHHATGTKSGRCPDRVSYKLVAAEPAVYRNHILGCWNRMCKSADKPLSEKTGWEMELGHRIDIARLRKPAVEENNEGQYGIDFDWKPAVTDFFR